ncbi:thioesterase II family protein [Streptomyces physcomitrii]|uniref:Thioesterase n=1 Tax=Streptomyces physcomitrii TaxID=2724184 RepID=A0ABX1HAC9_9ACTN|nr:alpha/beta fold hydrolase [Streptomyces physcomitrii]NKI44260.1 thioesterase [Streptomyces physcomitrii]
MTGTRNTDDLWIRRYHPAGPGAPKLVVLPHAGGSGTFFFPMAKALAPGIEVLAVQYPGRQDRHAEKLIESVAELADQLLPVLRSQLDGPFALFGHSMGATLSFELARRLEAEGLVAEALFPSARPAPSRHRENCTVHLGTDEELIAELRGLSGTNDQVLGNEELLRMTLPAVRGDYKAAETYRYHPGPKLKSAVYAMIGDQDPMVTEEEARAWAEHTEGPFTLDVYRGGHFYLVDHQPAILKSLADRLTPA